MAVENEKEQTIQGDFYVYILQCADGSLYTGFTNDPEKRFKAHNLGKGAKYTRSRLPVVPVYLEKCATEHDARSREWHIKRLSRAQKLELIECSPHP